MVIICNNNFEDNNYNKYFEQYPYDLSNFQKWALYSIINGHHTLVTSHTGSGKTLAAEFAIDFFKEKNKKVIYTGPIKALCNQKYYDFKKKFPHISFGIFFILCNKLYILASYFKILLSFSFSIFIATLFLVKIFSALNTLPNVPSPKIPVILYLLAIIIVIIK